MGPTFPREHDRRGSLHVVLRPRLARAMAEEAKPISPGIAPGGELLERADADFLEPYDVARVMVLQTDVADLRPLVLPFRLIPLALG